MTMPQAIRSALARWLTFSRRSGGTEYWWFVLFGAIVFGLASLLDHAVFGRDALFGAILRARVPDAIPRRRGPPLARHQPQWLVAATGHYPAGRQHRSVDLVLYAQHVGAQPVRPDAGCDLG
jgi:hypothetical protein